MNIKEQLEKLKKGTPIWIHWLDACSGGGGWLHTSRINKKGVDQELRHRTLGYFLTTTRDSLMVGGTRQTDFDKGGEFAYFDRLAVPYGMIKAWGIAYIAKPGKELTTTLARLEAWHRARPSSHELYSDQEGVGSDCERDALEEFIEAEKARTK